MPQPIFALAASTTPGPVAGPNDSAQRDPAPQRDFADMLARQSPVREGPALTGDEAVDSPTRGNGANGLADSHLPADPPDAEPLEADAAKDDEDTTPGANLPPMAMPPLPQQALEIAAQAAEIVARSAEAYRSTATAATTATATATAMQPAPASGNPPANDATAAAMANATASTPPTVDAAIAAGGPLRPGSPGQSGAPPMPAETAQTAAAPHTQPGQAGSNATNQNPAPASATLPTPPAVATAVQGAATATSSQAMRNAQSASASRTAPAAPEGRIVFVEQDMASPPQATAAVSPGNAQASTAAYRLQPGTASLAGANTTQADTQTLPASSATLAASASASAAAALASARSPSHESPERPVSLPTAAADSTQPLLAAPAQHGPAIPTAPGLVSHALIASPVGATQWGIDVGRQLAAFTRNQQDGQIKAELRLDPPDLGPLRITLSLNDGVATASFVSAHASVRQAVEAALPQLQQAFAQAGLSLGQSSVHDQGAGSGAGFDQQASQGRDDPERAGRRDHAFAGTSPSPDLPGSAKTRIASALIDTYA